jgi:hypothetical protein
MQPLYLARIEDLGRGDLVKVDCAACDHVALTPEFLLRLGISPRAKVLDLKERVRWRGCGSRDFDHVEPCPRADRHNWGGSESYGNTAAAKDVAPQIAAHNPRDESEIRIKDARVSARSSEAGVSNGSGRILLSTRSPPSGVHQIR